MRPPRCPDRQATVCESVSGEGGPDGAATSFLHFVFSAAHIKISLCCLPAWPPLVSHPLFLNLESAAASDGPHQSPLPLQRYLLGIVSLLSHLSKALARLPGPARMIQPRRGQGPYVDENNHNRQQQNQPRYGETSMSGSSSMYQQSSGQPSPPDRSRGDDSTDEPGKKRQRIQQACKSCGIKRVKVGQHNNVDVPCPDQLSTHYLLLPPLSATASYHA